MRIKENIEMIELSEELLLRDNNGSECFFLSPSARIIFEKYLYHKGNTELVFNELINEFDVVPEQLNNEISDITEQLKKYIICEDL